MATSNESALKSYSSLIVFLALITFLALVVVTIILKVKLDTEVVNSLVSGVIPLTGAYLGVDLASIIAKTSKMQSGAYSKANSKKYIAIILLMLLITLLLFASIYIVGSEIKTESTTMIKGTLGLATVYVAGMKGNKIATGEKQ